MKAPAASFTLAAYPGRRSTPRATAAGSSSTSGSVVDPAVPHAPGPLRGANPERLLRVGLFADVAIETTRAEETVAVPESAIVDEDGRPIVYVLLDGEHFEKRDLELGIRDSGLRRRSRRA